jgi:hypothetical protein
MSHDIDLTVSRQDLADPVRPYRTRPWADLQLRVEQRYHWHGSAIAGSDDDRGEPCDQKSHPDLRAPEQPSGRSTWAAEPPANRSPTTGRFLTSLAIDSGEQRPMEQTE